MRAKSNTTPQGGLDTNPVVSSTADASAGRRFITLKKFFETGRGAAQEVVQVGGENSAPKGRGRPPEAKLDVTMAPVNGAKKSVSSPAVAAEASPQPEVAAAAPKKRGRPPKLKPGADSNPTNGAENISGSTLGAACAANSSAPRKRGRPPKLNPEVDSSLAKGANNDTDTKASGKQKAQDWAPPAPLALTILEPAAPAITLSRAKTQKLEACEVAISHFWDAWVAAGEALNKIRSQELYQGRYDSFEEYVSERWHFRIAHAYRYMAGAEVMTELAEYSPIGEGTPVRLPDCEAKVRDLTSVPKGMRGEVWMEVLKEAGSAPVTARLVSRIAKPYQKKSRPGSPKPVIDVGALDVTDVRTTPVSPQALSALLGALTMLREAAKCGIPTLDMPELKEIADALATLVAKVTA